MAADDHFIIEHAGVWKPVGLGNRTSQAHWRPSTLDSLDAELNSNISFILTVFFVFFLTIAVTTPNVERSFSSMKRIKTFLWATMTDTRLSSLALIHIHRDFGVCINSVTDSFNEKKNRQIQTDLNNNTLTLNNFDMPRTLFRISKCNRLGTPPGVLSWAHGRVLCVFSMHKEESVFSYEQGSHTEHLICRAFGCLKRSPVLL